MSTLRQTLEIQAVQFASAIVDALRGASLDELLTITGGTTRSVSRGAPAKATAVAPKKAGRLGRRSPEDISRTLSQIVLTLEAHPEGLRAEQIKSLLGLDTREIPRPLAEGLKTGVLKKEGQKRATTYFVGNGEVGVPARKRGVKKVRAKR